MSRETKNLGLLKDEELMQLYLQGNEASMNLLYERLSPQSLGYLISKVRDRELAEEILQEAFLKFHKVRHQFDFKLMLRPWFFKILYTVMIDQLRAQKKAQGNRAEWDLAKIEKLAANTTANTENNMGAGATQGILYPSLQEWISCLPEREQKVLHMRFADDASFELIANTLRTTPSNIRQILHRSVAKLRTRWLKGGRK